MTALWLNLVFALSPLVISQDALELRGAAVQGGMIIGKTLPDSQIFLNGESLPISPQGQFILGFGRDYKKAAQLKIKHGNKSQSLTLKIRQRDYDMQHIDGLDEKKVEPPKTVWAQIRRENNIKRGARKKLYALTGFTESFVWPTSGQITGVYGSQRVLNGKPKRPHYGIDIVASAHNKIIAPASGVITLAASDFYFEGGLIFLDHGFGLSSAFLHLGKILVRVGQKVKQGETLALVGKTGRSTGAHLDWRLKWRRQNLDPALVVGNVNNCVLGAYVVLDRSTCYATKANYPAVP